MKKKIRNLAAMLMMMATVLLSGTMTAYAYVDESAEAEPETVIMEETPEETEDTPFSVAGNGELLDDITNDETKQFLTVQTKNGNTFFMVIDRSRNSENVYMLSLIDEYDLAEFIEEEKNEPVEEKPAVIVEEPQQEPVREEPQPEKGGMGMGALLTIILLGAGGVGGYYYFKILKPKREEEEAESEDLEFYDGGAYVNEDQESAQDEEEDEKDEEE